jgi:glutamate dehydrogenase
MDPLRPSQVNTAIGPAKDGIRFHPHVTKDENAALIRTNLIVEGANGSTTLDGDEILNSKGVTVVPDILAHAGGVTVSYFEWAQNHYGYYWEESEVEQKEEVAMKNAFAAIYKIKEEYSVTMREAAYMHSIKRISDAMKSRGWC